MASREGSSGLHVWSGPFAEYRSHERPAAVPTRVTEKSPALPIPDTTSAEHQKTVVVVERSLPSIPDTSQEASQEPHTVFSSADSSNLTLDQKIKGLRKSGDDPQNIRRRLRHKR